jgi:hypothetical protein
MLLLRAPRTCVVAAIREGLALANTGTRGRSCRACGRELPPRTGRGRIRLYCNASCRSAARRTRQADCASPEYVKINLTSCSREGNLNNVPDIVPAGDRSARTRAINAARVAFGGVPPDTALTPLEDIIIIRSLTRIVEDGMRQAVQRARQAGHTWAEIGELLGTTRQAAFQRFGHSRSDRTHLRS